MIAAEENVNMSGIASDFTGVVSIRVGADYFRNCAKREYSNHIAWIWIREALQNAVDAGATRVDITITENTITFKDNGKGMDARIICDKLLVLGGSEKDAGSTGGFGKAKEVLFFAWSNWSIRSSPNRKEMYYVESSMMGKEPIRKYKGDFEKGTIIEIAYEQPEYTSGDWTYQMERFIRTCTTKCEIYMDGKRIETLQARGSKQETDIAVIRVNKSKPQNRVYIRINGITMFSRYINTQIPALVTIDLKGESINLLSSSRESLQYRYQDQLDTIVAKILTNPRSTVTKDNNNIYIDKYQHKELESLKEAVVAEYECEYDHEAVETIGNAMDKVCDACDSGDEEAYQEAMEELEDVAPHIASAMRRVIVNGEYASKMGYSYIVHRNKNNKPSIDPTSPKAQKILHTWKRITDAVMKKYKPDEPYVVGFTFDETADAYHFGFSENGGETVHQILINPTSIPQYGDALSLGLFMFPLVCHEIAHIDVADHNEDHEIRWAYYMQELGRNSRNYIKLFNKAKEEAGRIIKGN